MTTLALGDLTVEVSRGAAQVPPKKRKGKYDPLRKMILKMKPGDPCFELPLDGLHISNLVRSVVGSLSSPPHGPRSDGKVYRWKLPHPLKTTTRWSLTDDLDLDGPGILRVWVVERNTMPFTIGDVEQKGIRQ